MLRADGPEERQERMGAKIGPGMISDKWTLETGWTEDGTE